VTRFGAGKVLGVLGGRMTFKMLSEQTGEAYAIVEQQIPAGQGPPPHVHATRRRSSISWKGSSR